jgi:hypothetical protein
MNTMCEIESPSVLVAGFQVRLESQGATAEGRVLSVGQEIHISVTSGAGGLFGLLEGTPLSLEFGGPGTLYVGNADIVRWADEHTLVLSQPPAYSVWRRLVHPRFQVRLPLTAVIGGAAGMVIEGETFDLSASGTECFLPGVELAIDAVIDVTVALPDGDLVTKAMVLSGGTLHSLRFMDLSKTDFLRLVRMCKGDQAWARTIVM